MELNERAKSHISFLEFAIRNFTYDPDDEVWYELRNPSGVNGQVDEQDIYFEYVAKMLTTDTI